MPDISVSRRWSSRGKLDGNVAVIAGGSSGMARIVGDNLPWTDLIAGKCCVPRNKSCSSPDSSHMWSSLVIENAVTGMCRAFREARVIRMGCRRRIGR
jgi:hypothetical protein